MRFLNVFYCLLFVVVLSALTSCSDHVDVNKSLEMAKQYSSTGKYRSAIIELKKLLQVDKKNKKARYILGDIYLVLGDGVNAEKEFKWARKLGIDNRDIALQIGRALLLQHKYKDVLNMLHLDVVPSRNKKALMLVLRGEAFAGMNDFNKAYNSFDAAAALDSSLSSPFVGSAKVSIRQGKLNDASAYLDKAREINSSDKEVSVTSAEISKLKGNFKQAEKILNQALKQDKAKNITEYKFRILTELVVVQILQDKLDVASTGIKSLVESFPKQTYVKYLLAWLEFKKQNYKITNTELLEIQRQSPDFLPGTLLLGATSYALGNYEQANIYLSRFVNKVPEHGYGRKLLAATQLKLNQPKKAIETLQLNSKTTDAELLAMMGQAAALTGNVGAQISYLKDLIKDNQNNLLLRKELAKIFMRQGDLKSAITELQFLHKKNLQDSSTDLLLIYTQLRAGHVRSAKKLAQRILQNKPSDPGLQAAMGDIYLVIGKRDMARQHFHESLKLQKNHTYSQLSLARMDIDDGNLAEADKWFASVLAEEKAPLAALLGRAQVAALQGKVDKMLSFLEKARASNVRAVSPRVILARYYSSIGKTDLALELAYEIKQHYRSKNIGYQLEGDIYMRARRYKEAQEAFNMALKKEPSADLELKLSRAHFLAGDSTKGLATLNKGLKQYPDGIGLRLALATYYQRVGNVVSAEKNYRELLEQQPSNIVALNNMSALLADKNPEKALSYAKQAYQLAPKSMAVTDTFGWLLVNHNQIKKGLRVLRLSASQGNNPTVKYHLAYALVKNRKKEEARTILSGLVKSEIKFPEQSEALALLSILQ